MIWQEEVAAARTNNPCLAVWITCDRIWNLGISLGSCRFNDTVFFLLSDTSSLWHFRLHNSSRAFGRFLHLYRYFKQAIDKGLARKRHYVNTWCIYPYKFRYLTPFDIESETKRYLLYLTSPHFYFQFIFLQIPSTNPSVYVLFDHPSAPLVVHQ